MSFRVYRGFAKDWPALHRWTPDYLRSRIGNELIEVMAGRAQDPRFEPNMNQHKQQMRFNLFLGICEKGVGNDVYMVANNNFWDKFGHFLTADINPPLRRAMFWMGPKGTVTPLHRDPVDVLHVQIVGMKRWRVIAPGEEANVYISNGIHSDVDVEKPDLKKFPLFKGVPADDAMVGPGDAVFVPRGWFHHVRAMTHSISIGFAD